jgi:hypothetical protein
MGKTTNAPRRAAKRSRHPAILTACLLAVVALSGCSDDTEADPEAWAAALEDVPGVTSADVEFGRFGPGHQADVTVRTDVIDVAGVEQVLRASVRRFVDVTAGRDTFGIDFEVRTADGTGLLRPESIGWDSGTIGFLREDVAAEADG